MTETTDLKKLYKNYIEFKANDQPDPCWIPQSVDEDILPDELYNKLRDSAYKFFDGDFYWEGTFSEKGLEKVINCCIGACIDDLHKHWSENLKDEKYFYAFAGDTYNTGYIDQVKSALFDCVGYSECSDFEQCCVTAVVLYSIGCNEGMIKEEIEELSKQDYLYQNDFDRLDLVLANYDIDWVESLFPIMEKQMTELERRLVENNLYADIERPFKQKWGGKIEPTYFHEEVRILLKWTDWRIKDREFTFVVLFRLEDLDKENIIEEKFEEMNAAVLKMEGEINAFLEQQKSEKS